MEEKNTERKSYEEPTLVKQGELIDVTEGGVQPVGSNVVAPGGGN